MVNHQLFDESFLGLLVGCPRPPEFTKENLKFWAGFNMYPVFIPELVISEDFSADGYVKPESWLYDQIRQKKVDIGAVTLKKRWCLADFSIGVDYTDGSQVFPNDPLTPVIERLRHEGVIGKHENAPLGSRFSIMPKTEWPIVCAKLAKMLRLSRPCCLEKVGEYNFIGNVYDHNRGKFNMLEWFNDSFEDSNRLFGGSREYGGLSCVDCYWSGCCYDLIAGRPLVSF